MGRDSGFIAAYATLANSDVNFCLVPEVPFTLEGFLAALERGSSGAGTPSSSSAEGAGQDLMAATGEQRPVGQRPATATSASTCGTPSSAHFTRRGSAISLKYIDPSYTIRSVPATAHDAAFCLLLGHNAVHAGMSGRTNMVVASGTTSSSTCPSGSPSRRARRSTRTGSLWSSVLAATGQPADMRVMPDA